MLTIALTGNIAAGKSTVAEEWQAAGARIIASDELARRAVEPGTHALARIAEEWGPGVLLPSGELNRAALRDLVFRDPQARARLEEIVHPEVNRLRLIETQSAAREGARLLVADIPLLFETGLQHDFDRVVLVDAPAQLRAERLVRDRGLSPEEAQRMIEAQWPAELKRAGADFIIENEAGLPELRARAHEVWSALQRAAAAPDPGGELR